MRDLAGLVFPYLWPADTPALRRRIVMALVVMIAGKLVNLTVPFFLRTVVDALRVTGFGILPLGALMGYGAARFGNGFLAQVKETLFARVNYRSGRELARSTYAHIFELSLRFHLERRSGELARAVDRGVASMDVILDSLIFSLVPTAIEFVLVLVVLLVHYSPIYAAITFLTIGAYALFTIVTSEWRTQYRREMNTRNNDLNAVAVDGLINFEVVKAFGNEALEVARLDRSLAAYEDAAVKSATSLAFLNAGQGAIIAAGLTILMILGAADVVAGKLTAGDVVLLNTFLLQLYVPLNLLGFVYRQLKQAVIDLEMIHSLKQRRPEIADAPNAEPIRIAGGRLRFIQVSFAYDARRPILEGIDFEVRPGRKLAIVGASGAGKSTIARLLFRFYDPSDGRIEIDGHDLRQVKLASLHDVIGVVPQDTVLFNDTIAANIAYGRPGSDRDEIVEAARVAQIDTFIRTLPEGYDTLVGERGLKLSGGEKQRVAIARVVLKNPVILVLDEATSALDSRTERELQIQLQRISAGRTTVVIAHRLSTVIDSDEIIVLAEGRIAEQGTHRSLLQHRGLYARLWQRQRPLDGEPAEDDNSRDLMPASQSGEQGERLTRLPDEDDLP
ncbi:ATP-binding cassette, subfamily B [Arboricoccus pini]|uniref:ATP-binding cassette, subfamily B n=1 Tax=Arboricoccus pini TaxID=1963835 RepID=A0A212R302_9PROT|nr:ATP-binding cassette, subfamily B [Arboricoccus pini]